MANLHRELNRVVEQFGSIIPGLERSFHWASMDGDFRPHLDIREEDDHYRLSLELPGMESKDVSISIENNELHIHGEKEENSEKKEGTTWHRRERRFGRFERILELPADANQDEVGASFQAGVLTITIQKQQDPEPSVKKIDIDG